MLTPSALINELNTFLLVAELGYVLSLSLWLARWLSLQVHDALQLLQRCADRVETGLGVTDGSTNGNSQTVEKWIRISQFETSIECISLVSFARQTWLECLLWKAPRSFSIHTCDTDIRLYVSNRSPEVIPSTTSTIPPLGVRVAAATSTSATSTVKSLCGRFQFQCQTSKECIAVRLSLSGDGCRRDRQWLMMIAINSLLIRQIYNVCDQIAQCEDGSDEGPEVRIDGEPTKDFLWPLASPFSAWIHLFSVRRQTLSRRRPFCQASRINRGWTFKSTGTAGM